MAAANKSIGDEIHSVEELKKKYDTTDVIYAGVAAKNGWSAGKKVTENEYTRAVAAFLKAPLGRR